MAKKVKPIKPRNPVICVLAESNRKQGAFTRTNQRTGRKAKHKKQQTA